jgi:hypothetical protein
MLFTHENIDGSGIVKKLYTKPISASRKINYQRAEVWEPYVWALSKAAELVI